MAIGTTNYADMVWVQHCVDYVSKFLCGGQYPIPLQIATVDQSQGLQAQVILASLVSDVPGIKNDICGADTLMSSAQSGLRLFGQFARWGDRPTPSAWIATPNVVQCEAGSSAVRDTLGLVGVLREASVIDGVKEGTIYRLEGLSVGHWLWKP